VRLLLPMALLLLLLLLLLLSFLLLLLPPSRPRAARCQKSAGFSSWGVLRWE
jgi:hypothetical protein